MPAAEIKKNIGDEIWNSYRKISIIRNPFDKVVSWFHFNNREAKLLARDKLIEEFTTWIHANPKNLGLDRRVYTIDGEIVTDKMLRYENLQDEFNDLCKEFGFESASLPHINSHQRGEEKIPYQEYYNDEIREIIADRYDFELKHFGYVF